MMSGAVFTELLEAWLPEGVTLLIPDLRSTGSSGPAQSGYALERYVDDVIAVLDAEETTRAVLIGHSMGGQVAQLIAARRPERVAGLVGVAPVPADGIALPDEVSRMFRSAGGSREALGGILDAASPMLSTSVRERLLSDAVTIAPECVARVFDTWSAGGFAGELDNVRAPALVVASDDPFLPVALLSTAFVQRIRGARITKLDGAGHYVPNEQPQALAKVLDDFMMSSRDAASC
jgi:non-heme chloroperoxidase